MDYEVDFIGVKDKECSSDALAVCIRWKDYNGIFHVGIYDAGYEAHGSSMQEFLNNYYFNNVSGDKVIDFVCVSHTDQDHEGGNKTILVNFTVNSLYMNRPWLYIDELKDYYSDGRMTEASLERELKEKYKNIADIETIAEENDIPIFEAFEGTSVGDIFTVLSPSLDFYVDLIIESPKTRLDQTNISSAFSVIKKASQYVLSVLESWNIETLRENQSTTPENEMSVVLFGEDMLFTGDAGIRALNAAADYYSQIQGYSLSESVRFIQIPHHGGRHNVSPTVLNKIVGEKVKKDSTPTKTAYVGVAEKSDHPLKMVVNAFIRRGCKVFKTEGQIIHHSHGLMPKREGWTGLTKEPFSDKVEEWD